jgi:methyl-accepting chemotaxis protein
VLAAALLLIVGGFCAMVLLRIVRPLGRITQRMQGMAEGHFPEDDGDIARHDEIGDVARALNAIMAYVENRAREESAREMEVQQKIVDSLGQALKQMAAGDLRAQLDNLPENYRQIAEDFHNMRYNFSEMIRQMSDTANNIFTGSKEISGATDDLASRTERQAATLARTAESIREITQAIHTTAANAREVDSSVSSANAQARQGGEVVEHAVVAMGKIRHSSEEIAKIIEVIESIAFQTNLLALNAGVEAARAGDAGRGFSVVASEVRALAHRTAESAQTVKDLIAKSSADVREGVELVGKTGTALEQIIQQISQATAQAQQITGYADNQAASMEQISGEIAQMDTSTQQNAAMVEEANAAVRNLFDEANALSGAVGHFVLERRDKFRDPKQAMAGHGSAVAPEPEMPRRVANF